MAGEEAGSKITTRVSGHLDFRTRDTPITIPAPPTVPQKALIKSGAQYAHSSQLPNCKGIRRNNSESVSLYRTDEGKRRTSAATGGFYDCHAWI
ncbi:hypothetical protein ABHI18_005528 [Aspergillus niger]